MNLDPSGMLDHLRDGALFLAGVIKNNPKIVKAIGGRAIDVTAVILVGYFVFVREPLQQVTADVASTRAVTEKLNADFTLYRIGHERDHTQLEREHTAIERSIRRRGEGGS